MAICRTHLILSVNRSLWGEVGPNLRAVLAMVDGRVVRLRFYIDGMPSGCDVDSAGTAASEVIADFPEHELDEQVIRLDAPSRLPDQGDWLTIFRRREPN